MKNQLAIFLIVLISFCAFIKSTDPKSDVKSVNRVTTNNKVEDGEGADNLNKEPEPKFVEDPAVVSDPLPEADNSKKSDIKDVTSDNKDAKKETKEAATDKKPNEKVDVPTNTDNNTENAKSEENLPESDSNDNVPGPDDENNKAEELEKSVETPEKVDGEADKSNSKDDVVPENVPEPEVPSDNEKSNDEKLDENVEDNKDGAVDEKNTNDEKVDESLNPEDKNSIEKEEMALRKAAIEADEPKDVPDDVEFKAAVDAPNDIPALIEGKEQPANRTSNFHQLYSKLAARKTSAATESRTKIVPSQHVLENTINAVYAYGKIKLPEQMWYFSQTLTSNYINPNAVAQGNGGVAAGDDSGSKTAFALTFQLPCTMKKLNTNITFSSCHTGASCSGSSVRPGVRNDLFIDSFKIDSMQKEVSHGNKNYRWCETYNMAGNLYNVPAGNHTVFIKLASLCGSQIHFQYSDIISKNDMPVSIHLAGVPDR